MEQRTPAVREAELEVKRADCMRNSNAMTEDRDDPGKPGVKLPLNLELLRQKLYRKAKDEPKFKFYTLYGHILKDETLLTAWRLVKRNGGAAGVDGITIKDIELSEGGVDEFLKDIQQELRGKTYKARPVKRIYIEKPGGGQRPLGIPTVRDRTVQAAARLILEAIFEADFEDCSYGFRPGRSAHEAVDEVRSHLGWGREVYDVDLKGYFDSIPHDKLMKCVEMRITDRSVLGLIRLWLQTAVVEEVGGGKKKTTRSDKGTPQGSVISPLLSNIYLHWFDRTFNREMSRHGVMAKVVRYADDILIVAKEVDERLKAFVDGKLEGWLGLELNRTKTQVINLKPGCGAVDFLGFTFRYDRDLAGRARFYLNVVPSAKSLKRERAEIKEMTSSKVCYVPIPELIKSINRHLKSWSGYFNHGYPRAAFRKINGYVVERLTKHLRRRSQRPFRPPTGVSYYNHLKKLGLVAL